MAVHFRVFPENIRTAKKQHDGTNLRKINHPIQSGMLNASVAMVVPRWRSAAPSRTGAAAYATNATRTTQPITMRIAEASENNFFMPLLVVCPITIRGRYLVLQRLHVRVCDHQAI